ncbi:acyltransferase family protein [Aureimonas phyllosphaerae]|uniref:acyltransferase family protein n=1 Tax=Aureimonas phyllosphaerae TaxID=1166078 RepID=UPI003A5BBB37
MGQDPVHRSSARERSFYRADIDGLRAVAVVAVLLFHAELPGFAGGYVGVDVFFVISGFLITSIICEDLDRGRFTFADFYARRVRRIFPALFATVLVTCIVAGCFFLPPDFRSLGASIAATAGFASNILFWAQADYFDAPAELKPLLHTWSLSIEEQFYLGFPCLLVLLWWMDPPNRRRVLAGLTAASFAIGVIATHKDPQAAFYLLPPRAWELLLGALLALSPGPALPPALARRAGWLGLASILLAVAIYDAQTPFPGFAALLPTLGAALVIGAGTSGHVGASKLLGSRPLVAVGRLSFSLYLWHWPVLSLLRYALARELDGFETAAALATSVLLAIVSWRFVEEPFRRPRTQSRAAVLRRAAAVTAGIFLTGIVLQATGGLPQRLPDRLLAYSPLLPPEAESRVSCASWSAARTNLSGICLVGDLSAPDLSFAVIGDSHAEALIPAFELAATHHRQKGLVFVKHACRPMLGVARVVDGKRNASCSTFVAKAIDEIRAQASIEEVVFAARWTRQALGTGYQQPVSFYTDGQSPEVSIEENKRSLIRGLDRAFDALSDRRITVIGAVPENEFLPPMALAMADLFRRSPPRTTAEAFHRRNAVVEDVFAQLAKWHRFQFIAPARHLCDGATCAAEIGGRSLYRDDDHLSAFGAEQLANVIDDMFEEPPTPIPPVKARDGN